MASARRVDPRLYYRDARQLSQVAAFFEGARPAGLVGYSPWRWPVLVGRSGALAYLIACRRVRAAGNAEVFENFLDVFSSTIFARSPERFRVVDTHRLPFSVPELESGYAHACVSWRSRKYFVVEDSHLQRLHSALVVQSIGRQRGGREPLRGFLDRRAANGLPIELAAEAARIARKRGAIPVPAAAVRSLAKRARMAPKTAAALLSGELLDMEGRLFAPTIDFDLAAELLDAAMGDDPGALWGLDGRGARDDDSAVARIARRLAELRDRRPGGTKPWRIAMPSSGARRPFTRLKRRTIEPDPALMNRTAVDALRSILARRRQELPLYDVLDRRRLRGHGLDHDDYEGIDAFAAGLTTRRLQELITRDPETLAVAVQQLRYDNGFGTFRSLLDELARKVGGKRFEHAADYIFVHQEGAH